MIRLPALLPLEEGAGRRMAQIDMEKMELRVSAYIGTLKCTCNSKTDKDGRLYCPVHPNYF
jgi:hypothetical protein